MDDLEKSADHPVAASPQRTQSTSRFGYYRPRTRAEFDKTANWIQMGGLIAALGGACLIVSLKNDGLLSAGVLTSVIFMCFGIVIVRTAMKSIDGAHIDSQSSTQPFDTSKLAAGLSPQLVDMERQIHQLIEEGEFQKAHTLSEELHGLTKIEATAQPESPKLPVNISQSDT